jgi:hypothetical protein
MRRFNKNFKAIFFGLFVFVQCLFFSCDHRINEDKKSEAEKFIKFYREFMIKKDSILLLSSLPNPSYKDCLFRASTEPEMAQFKKKDFLTTPGATKVIWVKDNMPKNTVLINSTDVPNIKNPKEWSDFRKRYREGYYVMSYPIVSNDLKYVIFYCEYNCGDRCGYGRLWLYKKSGNSWRLVKYYCDLIS